MKGHSVFLLSALLVHTIVVQSADEIHQLDPPYRLEESLDPINKIGQYSDYDFSSLLVPATPFLGFIGDDFRRMDMFFTSVSKSADEDNVYLVKGISLVANTRCDFGGWIRIEQVREFKALHFGVDEIYKDAGMRAQGLLIGRYRFEEMSDQPHSGVFDGVMASSWVLDRNGIMHSDHIRRYADNYRNNQYAGTWAEHGRTQRKVANWGEARIPQSGDLDVGAGEFSVKSKYHDKGWDEPRLP